MDSITTDSQMFTVVTNIHYHVAVTLFSFAPSLRERTACAARNTDCGSSIWNAACIIQSVLSDG
jgi:hypothetical protein